MNLWIWREQTTPHMCVDGWMLSVCDYNFLLWLKQPISNIIRNHNLASLYIEWIFPDTTFRYFFEKSKNGLGKGLKCKSLTPYILYITHTNWYKDALGPKRQLKHSLQLLETCGCHKQLKFVLRILLPREARHSFHVQ